MSTTIRTTGTKTMRYKCSQCGHAITAEMGNLPNQCPECQVRLKPARAIPVPMPVMIPPAPPIIVQVPSDPFDFVEEKKADLRERREAREENRQQFNEDRVSNPLGITGFAMVVTVMLVLLSGWIVAKSLPAYLYITASLAVPVAIAGLVMCIVGALKPSRQRLIAVTGVIVGAVTVLFMLPMSFMLRDMLAK